MATTAFMTFNPRDMARAFKEAGLEAKQADAIAEGMRQTVVAGSDLGDLATKDALAEHRAATKNDLDVHRAATKADLAEHRAATKDDLAEHRAATKDDLDALRKETKSDFHREIGTLRSEMRWMLSFQAAVILAIAAKMFGLFGSG